MIKTLRMNTVAVCVSMLSVVTLVTTYCCGEKIISYNKPAMLSSTFSSNCSSYTAQWSASYAVDGNLETRADSCQCCAGSLHENDPWLFVDLQGVYEITRIEIYGRSDEKGHSSQSFAGSTIHLDSHLADTIPFSTNWMELLNTTITPTRTASSVKFTLKGADRVIIVCELIVYGVCGDGFYGDCDTPCGNCKGPDICNKTTGECHQGCEPGYYSPLCTAECQSGRYGFNCDHRCGICRENGVCDIHTGECPSGCSEGFKGDQCLEEEVTTSDMRISYPVFAGALIAASFVGAAIVLVILAILLRQGKFHKCSKTNGPQEDTPTPLSENYETLHFNNPTRQTRQMRK